MGNPYDPPKSNIKKRALRREHSYNQSSVDWDGLLFVLACFSVLSFAVLVCTYYLS